MTSAYTFDLPATGKSIIKVIGVGGGGSNAVNHMYSQGIKDVEFIICNTDAQALKSSSVPNKLAIGQNLTEGLGAGANPEKGKHAALESKEEIREMLSADTKMVFITAGMGGGTGTGAAPVIAKVAKELGILTVGIVTAPFAFEGKKKKTAAENGVKELSENCDTILVILNDKLREMFGNLTIREAFAKADNVLTTAAKSIAEIITVTAEVNVDFEDVKTVMKDSGAAVMGSATTEGEGRALRAAEEALSSPLLNNTDIHGAQKILLSIMSGEQAELEMDELTEITEYIQDKAGQEAEVIFGHGIDSSLGQSIRVTVIATGFASDTQSIIEPKKTVFDLESQKKIEVSEPAKPEPVPAPEVATFVAKPVAPAPVAPPQPPVQPQQPQAPQQGYEPTRRPVEQPRTQPIVFELDGNVQQNNYAASQEEEIMAARAREREAAARQAEERELMQRRAEERRERLRMLSSEITSEAIKEKLDVPAYLRRNVSLERVAHSSERNISRFNLNDDNEILGDNRFLHDNVD
ncbi:cell division protein FtsZ [Pontibacter ummariensis]|uniref:Cell division protein FtsZ n=1 Tax=Pontibacter ummariensis TaxID=1610492 RepID=A0A239EVM8_9BACT|nr:cell division protein FtsZ [Pontibacter ummariensis]PRY12732.1 cell division protein FtsZ [Pontibacter ummariensis]SNS48491.1 cell division protein FtsZ [Pontibacter ummariensis]